MSAEREGKQIVPPHHQDAEMSVLGALLLDPAVLGDVLEIIGPDDFYGTAHRLIFTSIQELEKTGEDPDLVTLCVYMADRSLLEKVGGKAYLSELLEVLPSTANVISYARIIREHAVRRRLAAVADQIRREAYECTESAEIILDRAEANIFQIAKEGVQRSTLPVGRVLVEVIQNIERLQASPGVLAGLDTGFFKLNDLTGGLSAGELVVVAARPSMGKTTFALNAGINAALNTGARVLFFSLEMAEEQIATNLLCSVSRVDAHKIRRGQMSEQDWANLARGAEQLHEAPFLLDATPGLTPMGVRTKARRAATREGGLDLIIVDYMQLMGMNQKVENRQQEISAISRALKALSREMNCPVLALSQLNRSVDAREDHRPRLSDLRESGAIEQDADLILFLYRESYYHPEEAQGAEGSVTEVIVAKHRNGPTGRVELVFFPNYLKFENLAQAEVT